MVDVAAVSLPWRSSFSGDVVARGYGLRRHDPGAATPPSELGGIRKSTVYRLLGYRIKDVPRETPGKRNVGRTKSSWFSFLRAIAISSRFPSTKSAAAFSNPRLPSPLESTSSAVLVAVVAMPACLAWAEPPVRGRLGGGGGTGGIAGRKNRDTVETEFLFTRAMREKRMRRRMIKDEAGESLEMPMEQTDV